MPGTGLRRYLALVIDDVFAKEKWSKFTKFLMNIGTRNWSYNRADLILKKRN